MTGPITRLTIRPIRNYFIAMAEAMLDAVKKDEARPSGTKRLAGRSGKEKAPPPAGKPAMFARSGKSEEPSERTKSPRTSARRSARTSTPVDSGNDSEGEILPSYEVMMGEEFSPISPTPLVSPILPDLLEEASMILKEDARPVVEGKAAPPDDTPVVQGVDEVGCFSTNRVPMYSVPPPPLLNNMSNVPIGATLPHRVEVDTPCSRICILVPSQYAGVVQRVYGGDPVIAIQATAFSVAGTRNFVHIQGSLPGPSTQYAGPANVNGYGPMI